MSAIVCGKRSNFFEDNNNTPSSSSSSSPPVSKRLRCSSTSPVRYSPPRFNNYNTASLFSSSFQYPFHSSAANSASSASLVDHLAALFTDMDKQLLEKALEQCGDDLDSAIRSLTELRLSSAKNLDSALGKPDATPDATPDANIHVQTPVATSSEDNPSAPQNHSMDGADWVELFVREMMSASNMDDARNRASRALEFLEKSLCARATAEAAQGLQQVENTVLKEQLQALIQENSILKRAVSIQHERQKEFEDNSQELHNLKQMVSQYQEQLRILEVNNYALTLHLKQAQQSNSLPGRFHPDVF